MEKRQLSQEDALKFLLNWFRNPRSDGYSSYGYEFYLPNVMRIYAQELLGADRHDAERHLREISPPFYNAAWELCRRGILRPGIRSYGEQATSDGSSGNGYSVTPFGKQWLAESDKDTYVPTEPERFGEMLRPYQEKFGTGFYQRGQEGIRCYGAHAYLACCAMCGAAVESIFLQIAIQKTGDEEMVLKEYYSSGGRSKIENKILGKATGQLKRGFSGFSDLLKYWRDDASHGSYTTITDNEAFTALALLLRFCGFVNDNWVELVSKEK